MRDYYPHAIEKKLPLCFQELGDLLITGPTNTKVREVRITLA